MMGSEGLTNGATCEPKPETRKGSMHKWGIAIQTDLKAKILGMEQLLSASQLLHHNLN